MLDFDYQELAHKEWKKRLNEILVGLSDWFRSSFPAPHSGNALFFLQTLVDEHLRHFRLSDMLHHYAGGAEENFYLAPVEIYSLEIRRLVTPRQALTLIDENAAQTAARTYQELMSKRQPVKTSASQEELLYALDKSFLKALRSLHQLDAEPLPKRVDNLLWANQCAYIATETWSRATNVPNPMRIGVEQFRDYGGQVLWIDEQRRFTLLVKPPRSRHIVILPPT